MTQQKKFKKKVRSVAAERGFRYSDARAILARKVAGASLSADSNELRFRLSLVEGESGDALAFMPIGVPDDGWEYEPEALAKVLAGLLAFVGRERPELHDRLASALAIDASGRYQAVDWSGGVWRVELDAPQMLAVRLLVFAMEEVAWLEAHEVFEWVGTDLNEIPGLLFPENARELAPELVAKALQYLNVAIEHARRLDGARVLAAVQDADAVLAAAGWEPWQEAPGEHWEIVPVPEGQSVERRRRTERICFSLGEKYRCDAAHNDFGSKQRVVELLEVTGKAWGTHGLVRYLDNGRTLRVDLDRLHHL